MIKITPTITLELDTNIDGGQRMMLDPNALEHLSIIELIKSIEERYDSSTEDEYFVFGDMETYLQFAARWLKTINRNIDNKTSYLFVKCALLQSAICPRKNDLKSPRQEVLLRSSEWDAVFNKAKREKSDMEYVEHLRQQADVSLHIASYILNDDTSRLRESMKPHIRSALEKCLVEIKETLAYNVLDKDIQEKIFENEYDIFNAEDYWMDPSPIVQTFFNPNLWKYPRMIIPSPIGGRVFFERFTDKDIDNVVEAFDVTGHWQNEDMDFKRYLMKVLRDGISDSDVHKIIAKEHEAMQFDQLDTELFIPINSNRLFIRHLFNNEKNNDMELFEKIAI